MRQPITLKIKFKSATLDQFIERYSVDVSRGGIFIRTKEPLAVGTQLKFEFQLQDSQALISGEGTVTWIREHDPARTGVAPGMGVRFDKLATESGKVLDQILNEKTRRGEGAVESRFDAGLRASATASGATSSPKKHDFDAVDSKSMTPLPNPMPGFDNPEGEFGQESTRVMQDDVVQRLAEKTRGPKQEDAGGFSDEPTRARTAQELDMLANASRPIAVGDDVLDRTNVDERKRPPGAAGPVISSAPPPSPSAKPAAAAPSATPTPPPSSPPPSEPKPAVPAAAAEPAKPAATALPAPAPGAPITEGEPTIREERPPTRKKSSPLPAILGVGVLGAAAVGYFVLSGGQPATTGGDKPPVVAKQPENPSAPKPAEPTPPAAATKDPAAEDPAAKKAAAPPEEPKGPSVSIGSEPPGASVSIDGKDRGVTPLTLTDLEAKKSYAVVLTLKGYHEQKSTLVAKDGAKLEAKLVANEKVVEVSSTPPGADVFLDGKKVGRTPFTIRKLDAAKPHDLELRHVGFVPQTRKLGTDEAFESKGDRDVLAVALTLEAVPKAAPAAKKGAAAPAAAKKPEGEPAAKPAAPAAEKPAEPAAEKPAPEKAVEKPAEAPAEKPAPEKPAEKPAKAKPAEKPAEPAEDKAVKTPSWMKSDKPEGAEGQ